MSGRPTQGWHAQLRWLVISLATLMLALALIAVAGLIMQDGLMAELLALTGIMLAVPAICIGTLSFIMLIYARIRTVLSRDTE